MSYFDHKINTYKDVLNIIDKKIAKGKDIEAIRKKINKKIIKLEYLKSYT